jgi:hypothetical protein
MAARSVASAMCRWAPTVIAGGLIELREFRRLLLHGPYTHHEADPFIRLGSGRN